MTSNTDDLEEALRQNLKLRSELAAEVAKAKAASQRGIVYRLGWVLYWLACIVAGLIALVALFEIGLLAFGYISDPMAFWDPFSPFWTHGWFPTLPQNIVFGPIVWALGRAFRYVLSGE